jgi:hypothetical protein
MKGNTKQGQLHDKKDGYGPEVLQVRNKHEYDNSSFFYIRVLVVPVHPLPGMYFVMKF